MSSLVIFPLQNGFISPMLRVAQNYDRFDDRAHPVQTKTISPMMVGAARLLLNPLWQGFNWTSGPVTEKFRKFRRPWSECDGREIFAGMTAIRD